MEKFVEIFTLITGVIYVIFEIRQKNFMWVLGILTSLASMWMFFIKGAYASFGLNVYYFITAFIGLWQWAKDKGSIAADGSEGDKIHLNRLTLKVVSLSAVSCAALVFALSWGMERLYVIGLLHENPMPWLDASIAAISVVATWWLVKAYPEQWWLWIIANSLSMVLCISQQMWWMAALYAVYVASSFIGLRHWRRNGVLVA